MPRKRSAPQKPRHTRATAQIVVEGYTEEAFCKHLRSLYGRDCGVSVEIHNVRGGSPQDVVQSALVRKGFDRTFLFYDTDLPLPETWAAKSRRAGHQVIASEPCVEAFLLELLGKPCKGDTAACKQAFDAILAPPKKYDPREYAKLFPKELLDAARHPLLERLKTVFVLPE